MVSDRARASRRGLERSPRCGTGNSVAFLFAATESISFFEVFDVAGVAYESLIRMAEARMIDLAPGWLGNRLSRKSHSGDSRVITSPLPCSRTIFVGL
jgi:hypothetical protein